ncbi:DUF4148 domain-containing protein [Burkholderia anthina]|uniref:DUF4148 domain-containing protein n=1 Tax=Burkholderia anthina TaxID=179879 RepID=UPI00158CA44D|nr:DUF4148 domain-containing protein [Burkholderia anthina]
MKAMMIALAAVCATAAVPAFAQSNASSAPQQLASVSSPGMSGGSSVAQAGAWVAPYGTAMQGKTRAQVYQELVHAQQDGQLAYLNKTLYAHN